MDPKTNVEVQLVGLDGNVFSIIGRVSKALERGGFRDLAKEFRERALASGSYDEVLQLVLEYIVAT